MERISQTYNLKASERGCERYHQDLKKYETEAKKIQGFQRRAENVVSKIQLKVTEDAVPITPLYTKGKGKK